MHTSSSLLYPFIPFLSGKKRPWIYGVCRWGSGEAVTSWRRDMMPYFQLHFPLLNSEYMLTCTEGVYTGVEIDFGFIGFVYLNALLEFELNATLPSTRIPRHQRAIKDHESTPFFNFFDTWENLSKRTLDNYINDNQRIIYSWFFFNFIAMNKCQKLYWRMAEDKTFCTSTGAYGLTSGPVQVSLQTVNVCSFAQYAHNITKAFTFSAIWQHKRHL